MLLLSVVMLNVIYAECHYTECHYAECHSTSKPSLYLSLLELFSPFKFDAKLIVSRSLLKVILAASKLVTESKKR